MDWIKIKHKHIPANMTDAELGKLVKFQLEIARREVPMTDEEKNAFFGRKEAQESWENVKKKHRICEDFVTKKVLEDCEKVASLRQRNAKNKANSRLKQKNVTGEDDVDVTEQIREDKIREDKSVCSNNRETPHTFFKLAFRIFKIRKLNNPKIDTGLLAHLVRNSSDPDQRSLWAIEIEKYKKNVELRRKSQLESRKIRAENLNLASTSADRDSFVRSVTQRFESLKIDDRERILRVAVDKYAEKHGQILMPGKASSRFIVGAMAVQIDEIMRQDEIVSDRV